MRALVLAPVLLAVALLAPGAAHAQSCSPSPTEVEEARALFIAGSAAVDAGRWSDAIASFERAYQLSCAPSALYNLAMALRALGRHREARDGFDRLMQLHPDLGGELRMNAVTYRREEANRVAVLELLGIDQTRPEISFDGRAIVDQGQRPVQIETDAGSHSLVARIPDHQPFVWEGALRDGQREQIEVRFLPIVNAGGDFDPLPLILGIVAAGLIAGGIAVGYVVWDESALRPLQPDRTVRVGAP